MDTGSELITQLVTEKKEMRKTEKSVVGWRYFLNKPAKNKCYFRPNHTKNDDPINDSVLADFSHSDFTNPADDSYHGHCH